MIKVNLKTKIATPEPIPDFLKGLKSETLMDLSWTDVSLGVSDCAWWPETIVDNHDPNTEYVDGYEYTINEDTKTVTATAIIKSLSTEVITEKIIATIAAKHTAINATRDEKLSQGVPYSFPDGIGTIQTRDLRDIINIMGSVVGGMILQGQEITIPFRDEEDKNHILTPEQTMTMGMAALTSYTAIYQTAWAHKDALKTIAENGATIAQIEAYDINTGW